MTKPIRTFAEAMEDIRKNAPSKAMFNIMGYEVELERDKCQNYEDACRHIADQAPPELIKEMNELEDEEYVETMGALMTRIYVKFGDLK